MWKKNEGNFRFSRKLYVIKPVFQMEYQSIIVDENGVTYSRFTPLQLVKLGCLNSGADYNGRRKSIMFKTSMRHKIPIAGDPEKNIYLLPTHSPTSRHCHWIFFHAVKELSKAREDEKIRSIVRFKNGYELKLNVSVNSMKNQFKQTLLTIAFFKSDDDLPKF